MTRSTDYPTDQELRKQIMESMAACKDDYQRTVLLLLREVLDSIGRKIDIVMRDEQAIREIVLNGDSASHHDDHREWREFREEWQELKPVVRLMRDRQEAGGHCQWAKGKIAQEKIDTESTRKVRDGWMVHAAWAVTMLIVVALYAKYLGGAA